jgi:hypothetical protein
MGCVTKTNYIILDQMGIAMYNDVKEVSKHLSALEYLDVIEVSFFYQSQQSRCLLPPHLRMGTDADSETLCSVEYHTMDKVLKSSNPDLTTVSCIKCRMAHL